MPADPPNYRLRLFLSVDLVGSTSFKSKSGNSNLKWIKAFQKFYGEFPAQLAKNYADAAMEIADISEDEKSAGPQVWKTIGDEILFVNRVNSITHLGLCITAFSKTLIDFGREIATFNLNTKGNAWVAAFPTPNMSIKLIRNGGDPLTGEGHLPTEAREASVDENPSEFDFLGKGIDGWFRISRNSTINDLTVSPALAFLLCKARRNIDTTKFKCRFTFHEPQVFKGVVNEVRYPVISISTSRDKDYEAIRKMEAELLQKPDEADAELLHSYLEKFIEHHGIEQPTLKLTDKSAHVAPPDHYRIYLEEWRADYNEIEAAIAREENSAAEPEGETGTSERSSSAANWDEVLRQSLHGSESRPRLGLEELEHLRKMLRERVSTFNSAGGKKGAT